MTGPEVHAKITDFRDPTVNYHAQCPDCHAAGMFFHKAEAQEWADNHQCPDPAP